MKFTIIATAIAFTSSVSALISNCAQEVIAKEGDTCRTIAIHNKITTQQVYRWNFVGNENPAGDCSALVPGEKYCVKVDTNLRKRNWFYKTKGLSGSKLALAKKKIAAAKKTTTTKKATTVPVTQSKPGMDWSSTPANAPPNAVRHIISTCTKYATVTKEDSWCGPFAEKYGITLDQLYSWNAFLHKKTCDNLDDNRAYCIGV